MKESITLDFKQNVIRILSNLYHIRGAEILLLRKVVNEAAEQIFAWEGRPMEITDLVDVVISLERYGIEGASADNRTTLIKYGEQLICDGKRFNKPDKIKSGEAILRRMTVGGNKTKEGD